MLELRYERQVHVEASCVRVQQEISDLEQLLSYLPQTERVTVSDDGRRAALRKIVALGPIRRSLDIVTELTELPMNSGVFVIVRVPALKLRAEATFGLARTAAHLTLLHCTASARSTHPRAAWMRNSLLNSLQDHLDTFTTAVSGRLGRISRAEKVFSELDLSTRP